MEVFLISEAARLSRAIGVYFFVSVLSIRYCLDSVIMKATRLLGGAARQSLHVLVPKSEYSLQQKVEHDIGRWSVLDKETRLE